MHPWVQKVQDGCIFLRGVHFLAGTFIGKYVMKNIAKGIGDFYSKNFWYWIGNQSKPLREQRLRNVSIVVKALCQNLDYLIEPVT